MSNIKLLSIGLQILLTLFSFKAYSEESVVRRLKGREMVFNQEMQLNEVVDRVVPGAPTRSVTFKKGTIMKVLFEQFNHWDFSSRIGFSFPDCNDMSEYKNCRIFYKVVSLVPIEIDLSKNKMSLEEYAIKFQPFAELYKFGRMIN